MTDTPESSDLLHRPRYETRVPEPHVPKDKQQLPAIVYHELEQIGKGAIGSVSRVMDLQSGRIITFKIIPVEEGKEKDLKESARNEVETLANNFHVSRGFSSCLGYLLTVTNRITSLALCFRKAG